MSIVLSVVIELSSSVSIRQVSNQNNPYIAVSARMSQDARAAMAQHIRDEGDTFMLFVPSVYLSLMATPLHQRSNEHTAAIEKLRMCSPIAMREVGDTNDAVAPDLCPLIVSYMTSLAPAELMLIRKSDGDLLAPLIPGVNADSYSSLAELKNCGNCGSDSLSVDFLECPACNRRLYCRECFASFADLSIDSGDAVRCTTCAVALENAEVVKFLQGFGLVSTARNFQRAVASKRNMCPIHRTVVLDETSGGDRALPDTGYCLHCKKLWCVKCPNPAHQGMDCDEATCMRSGDQLQRLRIKLMAITNRYCPRCKKVFLDVDVGDCFDVQCQHRNERGAACGCHFCGFCFKDCGMDGHPHLDTSERGNGPCPFQKKYFPHLSKSGSEAEGEKHIPPYYFPWKYSKLAAGIVMVKRIKALLRSEFPSLCSVGHDSDIDGGAKTNNDATARDEVVLFNTVRKKVLPALLAGSGFIKPHSFAEFPRRRAPARSVEERTFDDDGVDANDYSSGDEEPTINDDPEGPPDEDQQEQSEEAYVERMAEELGMPVADVREMLAMQRALDAAH